MKFVESVLRNKFNAGLISILIGLFLYQLSFLNGSSIQSLPQNIKDKNSIHLFYHPDCPHCQDAIKYFRKLQMTYPVLTIQAHNIEIQKELESMMEVATVHNISTAQLRLPLIVVGKNVVVGYNAPSFDSKIMSLVEQLLQNSPSTITAELQESNNIINIPIFGEINVLELSLPVLAIVLGTVDGFNPCAMWVLVYMISLIVGLKDRTRIFIIIGTFILTSGILYFLFMTVWLNIFLLVRYVRTLTLIIGFLALYLGLYNIYNFVLSGGQLVCKVGDPLERQERREKIKELITSPITIMTIIGIIFLAFAVNSIEFICSSALPAVFVYVLSISDVTSIYHYFYIMLYVFFFMLDDLVIFVAAALAVKRFAGEKYAGLCNIIGGVILVVIGVLLSFFPDVLSSRGL